ncbi:MULTISPECIES: GntR family transcriptional regulator [Actinomycetes]|uniref:GntR family transcriptional regulator n=2 Tax=Actinomycetes TaxID=1760 RepID=A0ABP6LYH4_9MICC|nr:MULTISPECIES: GntR family transcriptional regulator [unclassified Nesterenkonia]MDS2174332.1 GntR family transcriptional regulator [Nesterenkonia sp. CL21]OSM43109.1 GntR family transcriptional regulator [Nesterenkonia sp. PF2B19]
MTRDLDITLDRSSPVPLYHQVASAFEKAIRDGLLPPETKLENEIALAKRYNLSRPTMRQAMDQLVQNGLVVRRRGVGTQVVGAPVRRNLRLSSLYNDLQDEGATPQTTVLSLELVEAETEIAEQLNLTRGAEVHHMVRLRTVDGRALALMENWVPRGIADFEQAELESDGLYNLLRRAGIDFRMAHQTVGAGAADARQAELLDTEVGAPLVMMDRTALDSRGIAVECGHHVYRADMYSFDITLVN